MSIPQHQTIAAPASVHRALSFLLDTNVTSELTKPRPNANAIAWLGSVSATDLFGIM
jgi:hypothetical protein